MARGIPPPDFRYVWLTPARRSAGIAFTTVTALAAGAGGLLWNAGHFGLSVSAFITSALVAAATLGRGTPAAGGVVREATMVIVPWGILIDPDTELRVLRWPAIRRVTVEVTHSLRGGTPVAVSSMVTIDTGRERLVGRTWGAVGLEGLTVGLDAYAEEAARPVALDLDGTEQAGDGGTEPVMADLLARADDLCTTGRGALILGLPSGGYRSVSTSAAGPETIAILHAILTGEPGGADARPLASILAALLGARETLPDLLRLTSAPHPVVAAVAKAAALRLGAPQSRAGAVDEVAAFLFEDDLVRIERWAHA